MSRALGVGLVGLLASLVACGASSSTSEPDAAPKDASPTRDVAEVGPADVCCDSASKDANGETDASPVADADSGADAGACISAPTGVPAFTKRTLDKEYRAEGVGAFDVNTDGHVDIVTDQYWYEGPDLTPHEIRTPVTFVPTANYADCFGVFPRDLDGDGFTDIIVAPHVTDAMYWYRNPAGARDTHWTQHLITPAGVAGLETPYVVDLFHDGGPPVLLSTDSSAHLIGWYEPQSDPTLPWVMHPISVSGSSFVGYLPFTHGIGVGDVDRDGLLDVLTGTGWFQQTSDRTKWNWKPVVFGPDPGASCSRMYAFDFDGDGQNDILCARPHDYGLFWFQQVKPTAGADPTFTRQLIDDTLSEMHALRFDDLDADGIPEIITGKRYLAHADGSDPGGHDPALLVYYSVHDVGTPAVSFERHLVDDDSGIGGTFSIADVDGDCKQDLVTANKKGLYFFPQK